MTDVPSRFDAFRIHDDAAGYRSGIERISLDDLAQGEVVIRAVYSSVNYKDALAGTGKGKILRTPRFAGFWNFLLNISPKKQRDEQLRMSGIALLEST